MENKPKLLILISTFFPAKNGGGPVVSMLNMAKNLKNEFELYFIADHHDFGSDIPYSEVPVGWHNTENYKVYYIPVNEKPYGHINSIIENINPDAIYLNSIFDVKYSITALMNKNVRNKKIPLIISPRGELCIGAMKLKGYKKYPFIFILNMLGILKGKYWHVTSEDEYIGVNKFIKNKDKKIFNIPNIPTIFSNYSKREKVSGDLNLVFISRIQRKKNLYFAIKTLNQIKNINITYDIYGPMEDYEYWNKCKELIKKSPSNVKIRYIGQLEHEKVEETLSKYHMFYMPTYSENYGHAIVESMECGVPVLISNQTPWNHINDFNAGFALPLDDEISFINTLIYIGKMSNKEYDKIVENCLSFVKNEMNVSESIECTIDMFNSIIKNQK